MARHPPEKTSHVTSPANQKFASTTMRGWRRRRATSTSSTARTFEMSRPGTSPKLYPEDGESASYTGALTKTDQRRENIQRLKEDEDAEERPLS